jgi:hypothetical protein
MSHKFRKPKPISAARRDAARANGAKSHRPVTPEGKAKSALNAITHGLTASAVVLTTESKEKYDALLAAYRDEYSPQGQTENDLVEEMTTAKWLQRRSIAMITALVDLTMDRMEKEIAEEFEQIDNASRTALAFMKQTDQSATLALLNRYASRHARDYHRALNKLREIQSEKREQSEELQLATGHRPLATEVSPLENEVPNEPKRPITHEPSTTSEIQLVTGHRPLATECERPLATEVSPLVTRHSPLVPAPDSYNKVISCESSSASRLPRP